MNPPLTSDQPLPSPLKSVAATYAVGLGGTAAAVGLFLFGIQLMQQHHLGRGWFFGSALAYGMAILAVAFIAARAGQRVSGVRPTPAARRYHRRFFLAMAAYVGAMMGSSIIDVALRPGPWLAWPLALAPSVAIVATIVVMGLYLREETDELERSIVSESALWATGGLLAIASTWGFLEQFGLVVHVEAWTAFVVWAVCLGPATALVRRRYR